jgi:hypothetical protein
LIAVSGIGHAGYLLVRLGPVFRIASLYVKTIEEKAEWSNATDKQRLLWLCQGKYPWLTFELSLLTILFCLMIGLRLTTMTVWNELQCTVEPYFP